MVSLQMTLAEMEKYYATRKISARFICKTVK